MKKVVYGNDAKEQLFSGVKKLSKAVKVTLGPAGKNVLIKIRKEEPAIITKDGVTVASSFSSNDVMEQIAIEAMQLVSRNSDDQVGDGTTTATVLAEYILENGLSIPEGYNLIDVKKGIDLACKDVIKSLDSKAQKCKSLKMLNKVAMISSNGDKEISDLVVKAFKISGKQGVVNIRRSPDGTSNVTAVTGMLMPTGFKSKGYITDHENENTDLKEPLVFSTNKKLMKLTSGFQFLLDHCSDNSIPLLIICKDMDVTLENMLIQQHRRGTIDVCVCKAPGFGHEQIELLRDIGVTLGKAPFLENEGLDFDDLEADEILEELPFAKLVRATEHTLSIEGFEEHKKAMRSHADLIRKKLDSGKHSQYEKTWNQARISRLTDGIAFINIGANSEVEATEKQHRIQDSLYAVKYANEEGIIPGGGAALLTISDELKSNPEDLSRDMAYGYTILLDSIKMPFKQICINSGKEKFTKEEEIKLYLQSEMGYDARAEIVTNMIDADVIDPVKVTKTAVKNAVSISSLLLTTECVIADSDAFKQHEYNVE